MQVVCICWKAKKNALAVLCLRYRQLHKGAGGIIGALCRFGRQKYFHGSIIHLDSYRTLAAVKELDMRWDHVASKDRHTRGGKNHTRKGEIQLQSFPGKKEWRSIANIVRCSNFKEYENVLMLSTMRPLNRITKDDGKKKTSHLQVL